MDRASNDASAAAGSLESSAPLSKIRENRGIYDRCAQIPSGRARCGPHQLHELLHPSDEDLPLGTPVWANQLRVLMTAAAYVLIEEIRLAAALTAMAVRKCGRCANDC
jgi:hypothetical protein